MKREMFGRALLDLLALLALLLVTATLSAASGYDLPWWTADRGGGTSAGAGYRRAGTIGQSDGGPALNGGSYRIEGGFWGGASSGNVEQRLSLALREDTLLGIPATGKQVKIEAIGVFHVVNGQLTDNWVNFDALGLLQQLGVVQAPSSVPGSTPRSRSTSG